MDRGLLEQGPLDGPRRGELVRRVPVAVGPQSPSSLVPAVWSRYGK